MNERIVKLFMESVDSNYIPVPIEDHIPSWIEKFAELIVRECDRYVAEQYDELEPWMQPGDLLKHFGVEE